MMKNYFSLLLALLLSMVSTTVLAYHAEIDGIYYNFSGTNAEVTNGDELYTGSVVIPETVMYNGTAYPVTSIGESAFYNCSGLTSVDVPNSVTSIGGYAFYGCSNLKSIYLPCVTSISGYAFYRCNFERITLGSSITNIERLAFLGGQNATFNSRKGNSNKYRA